MNERQASEAVRDWIDATLPALLRAEAYVSAQKTLLPDVMVEAVEKRTVVGDRRFPWKSIQQAGLRVVELNAYIMVEAGTGDTADRDETQQLQGFGADLEASLLEDGTLGDRVQMASPLARFDYSLPFVRYQDGTRGRQMQVNLAVAELVPELEG